VVWAAAAGLTCAAVIGLVVSTTAYHGQSAASARPAENRFTARTVPDDARSDIVGGAFAAAPSVPPGTPKPSVAPRNVATSTSPTATAPAPVAATRTGKSATAPNRPPVTAPATTTAPSGSTLVIHVKRLDAGQSLRTNVLSLGMQGDGNLVLRNSSGGTLWASMTLVKGSYAAFQTDGNLVVYTGGGKPLWDSGTQGHDGATLELRGDGNMVIYAGGTPIWSTGTHV
jgi:hypothetical protein